MRKFNMFITAICVLFLVKLLLLDIDECAPNNITGSKEMGTLSGCHHVCSNVEGSYECSCRSGYKLMYDKKRCQGLLSKI